jgi:hypothetical protein
VRERQFSGNFPQTFGTGDPHPCKLIELMNAALAVLFVLGSFPPRFSGTGPAGVAVEPRASDAPARFAQGSDAGDVPVPGTGDDLDESIGPDIKGGIGPDIKGDIGEDVQDAIGPDLKGAIGENLPTPKAGGDDDDSDD